MQYELFYLIGASRETEMPEIKAEVEKTVTAAGGVFEEKETAEKRRLSYKIKHENHGLYIARRFELEDAEKVTEIVKNLNLNARVLRFLISKADELPALKSKEERIEEAAKRDKSKDSRERKPEPKKAAPVKKETSSAKAKEEAPSEEAVEKEETPVEEAPQEKKQTDEDIDKKLEEILNI